MKKRVKKDWCCDCVCYLCCVMFLVTDGCLDLECYRSCCLGSSEFFKKKGSE